jgi:3',5'-cyclic AMP phosphodiesterase CpdA
MKKIIHLSDLHLGSFQCETHFRSIVAHITMHLQPAEDYIIVITGDLMEKVKSEACYSLAKGYLVSLEHAGFRVLVVPGNHDYGKGIRQRESYVPIFKKVFYGNSSMSYPKKDLIDGIAFLGLDSMEEEVKNDSRWADGRLGAAQLQRLKHLLTVDQEVMNARKRVVYLHHRPFFYLGLGHYLKDREALKAVLEGNRVDLLLFGHKHFHRTFHGTWGIPRAYDGGTSTRKGGLYSPHRIIDLSQGPEHDLHANFLTF